MSKIHLCQKIRKYKQVNRNNHPVKSQDPEKKIRFNTWDEFPDFFLNIQIGPQVKDVPHYLELFCRLFLLSSTFLWGFPGGLDSKDSICNTGDLGSIPGSGRSPGERNGYPTPVFLPGESHRQRNLVGYSPRSHKESDTTE